MTQPRSDISPQIFMSFLLNFIEDLSSSEECLFYDGFFVNNLGTPSEKRINIMFVNYGYPILFDERVAIKRDKTMEDGKGIYYSNEEAVIDMDPLDILEKLQRN